MSDGENLRCGRLVFAADLPIVLVMLAKALRILRRQAGQGLVEYALILTMVSIVAIVSMGLFAAELDTLYDDVIAAFGA
ncbi:MAG: hypothetical protein WEB00_10425 [Dehalococcoidia bacterium]